MESLPHNKILKFRPDTMSKLRKMYNLDKPGQMDEVIDILQDWLKKEGHLLKKNFSREYLERGIIMHKGSVERTKVFIDKMCTYRTVMPELFDKYHVKNDFGYLKSAYYCALLPNLTEDFYRIIALKMWNNNYTTELMFDCYKFNGLLFEYIQGNDYAAGLVIVYDLRDVSLTKMISTINLLELTQAATIFLKGYMFRLKEIHLISSSKTIEILINLVKNIVSEKIANRIYVHTALESLYKYVPKELLPADLDGNEKPLEFLFDELLDVLSKEENIEYFKDLLSTARVDKSYKQIQEFNEMHNGIQGTFRTLNLD